MTRRTKAARDAGYAAAAAVYREFYATDEDGSPLPEGVTYAECKLANGTAPLNVEAVDMMRAKLLKRKARAEALVAPTLKDAMETAPRFDERVTGRDARFIDFGKTSSEEVLQRASIRLTRAELQSGHDRQKWAEGLITQLPATHDGRNSWLLNFGIGAEAVNLRAARGLTYDHTYRATLGHPELGMFAVEATTPVPDKPADEDHVRKNFLDAEEHH